ncbi:hypothetical protein CULT_10064 [[Clostridium] ultunense Esp]|nr:hypothetical protein CULT_10064 [[Clostridium] ultunense Esp]
MANGLIPVFYHAFYRYSPLYEGMKMILTIHNLKYQGVFSSNLLTDVLGIGWEYFTPDRLEYYGNLNFLKGGIAFADAITTVSKSYAEEIQNPYFGEGLDGLLRARTSRLFGIVNGIDYDSYNPEKTFPFPTLTATIRRRNRKIKRLYKRGFICPWEKST